MKELVTDFGRYVKSALQKVSEASSDLSIQVVDDVYSRRTYSKDLWPRNLILSREKSKDEPSIEDSTASAEPAIDAIFWPETQEQLSLFMKLAFENNWEVYPYGAGSGVCGGATVSNSSKESPNERRKRVVIDFKRMDKIESIDEVSQVAKVQAGIIGQVLEENLNAKGFTLGHFPSSIYCSSFGGYLATRAAGQLSTYYGKIEDMVLATEGVLPTGEMFTTPVAPRMSVGPDWNQLLLGSEGTLALLTGAWVKVHRLPQNRRFISFHVESSEKALEGVRKWLQAGLRPAAVRIYDEDESRILMDLKSGVKLVAVAEGEIDLTDFTARKMNEMGDGFDGWFDSGEEPAQSWWSKRYDISYYQQLIMSHRRMILDTFEVSTSWAELLSLYKSIKNLAGKFSVGGESGLLMVLAHFSHFYHTGGNIYFTICGRSPENFPTEKYYDEVWDSLLTTCLENGAAVSHHHGIGRLKAQAAKKQRGAFTDILKKLKHEMDTKNILNPSNLGL